MKKKIGALIWAVLVIFVVQGQTLTVRGKVTDAGTGDPVPFANVFFTGTQKGITTDFEGYYVLQTQQPFDSITVSYVGYKPKTKAVGKVSGEVLLNFQLEEDVVALQEVVFYAGENPAFPIMRNVVRNKDRNNKFSLDSYEYEAYTKIEIDIDKMSEKFRNRKTVQKITSVLDSIEIIAGEDGQPVLPVFFSEAISRIYYKNNPTLRHENIIKTRISGVGITDGTLTSQFIGSTFQEYNFYRNWLNIVDKEFVSPIADGWKLSYEYDLIDSLYLDGVYCYQLDFFPKRDQDLAFSGTMWITKDGYALKRIDATVNKRANLNYIEKIKIQQELAPTVAGAWLPIKTRVLLDVGELSENTPGMLAKFYISTRDVVVNQPKPNEFYELPVRMEEDVRDYDTEYWSEVRHDSLTDTEVSVYSMIDTLSNLPSVKTYMEIAKFVANTYLPVGKIDIGPYTGFYTLNDIEGMRIGFGARTNYKFSKKWVFSAMAGYGFGDERWKYDLGAKFIVKRHPWTTVQVQHKFEINPIFLLNDESGTNSLFYAYTRFGTLIDPFAHRLDLIKFERQLHTGLTGTLILKNQHYTPEFDFQYKLNPEDPNTPLRSSITTTEANFELRYAKDELFVINDNERLSMGTNRYPAITLRYTLGMKDVLGGDFSYHKVSGAIQKNQKMGILGRSYLSLSGQYIFSQLPYPMLFSHIGNQTPFYIGFANNLMNYYEFTSDYHAAFRMRHHFEGLILNRIPLMKRLKWRMVANADVIYGGIRDYNVDMVMDRIDDQGNAFFPFQTFDNRPYVELGYGVENIFKILRVDFFHRMTYLERPDIRKYGIKFSFQFIL